MARLICPKCQSPAQRTTTRYGVRNSCCDLWSWDAAPLVCAETHDARKAAHAAFDRIWQSGAMKRGMAYARLAEELGLPRADCHMKIMDATTARKVPDAAKRIMESTP